MYTLHGQILEVVTSARYLGVDIFSGLSWNSHIDRTTGNDNRTLGYIRRNIKTKNRRREEQHITCLSALSWSMLPQFGTRSPRTKRSSSKKMQRRTARWTGSNYGNRSSVTVMLDQLGWRTLEQRRSAARLCLFYKIVYGLVAVPYPEYVQPIHRVSRYCHSMTFRQIQTSTNYYKYSFVFTGHNKVECSPRGCC